MKRIIAGIFVFWALMFPGLRSARAQYDYSLNYQTNTINVVSNWVGNGNYIVGDTTYQNALVITNGGTLSGYYGILGFTAAGSNNAVIVNGGSWSNQLDLTIGYASAGNSMVVSNQGVVFNRYGNVGAYTGGSNNNVLVTGEGSVWNNGNGYTLYIGTYGAGNSLVISNQGVVLDGVAYVGYWDEGVNNHVLVTGSGSVWSNSSDLAIGNYGNGNSLVISDQGQVFDRDGLIGAASAGGGGVKSNSVVVTGAGSVWQNSGGVSVGSGIGARDNSLVISDQGAVFDYNGQVGYIADNANNTALVTGNGSIWSNENVLMVGALGSGNHLVISNQGAVVSTAAYMGYGGSSNSALVTGTGSVWSNGADLYVGYGNIQAGSGFGNSLEINNQGAVINGVGLVGYASTSNSVLVTGSGSVWSNRSTLYVGTGASGNRLVISNQAAVFNQDAYVGYSLGNSNTVRVVDGSTWVNAGSLYLGYGGTSNLVDIVGSTVVASNAVIGFFNPDWKIVSNNEIRVESGNLFVTNTAGDGSLVVNRAVGKGSVVANNGSIIANNLDIGGTGTVFATTSRIRVTGATTNNGTFTMISSVGTFGTVFNSGAWITDPTTNIFNGDHLVTSSGYISASAGDVYIFKSNFVNQSTQSNSWNTLNTTPGGSGASGTKFIFDGTNTVSSTGYTQQFFTAGLKLTGGFVGTPPSATATQQVSSFAVVTGFQNNFALDRLELGNLGTNSLLEFMDSFPLDGNPAALFVNDLDIFGSSQLIISNNVTLYFVNSNNWSAANISLLGNAELHQLVTLGSPVSAVPEPSICLLLAVGAVMIYHRQRRKHSRRTNHEN